MEVTFKIRLSAEIIRLSSMEVVTFGRPATGFETTKQRFNWLKFAFIIVKLGNDEHHRKVKCLWLICCFKASQRQPELLFFHLSSGSQRKTFVLKTKHTMLLNTFYQHLHAKLVMLHNAG